MVKLASLLFSFSYFIIIIYLNQDNHSWVKYEPSKENGPLPINQLNDLNVAFFFPCHNFSLWIKQVEKNIECLVLGMYESSFPFWFFLCLDSVLLSLVIGLNMDNVWWSCEFPDWTDFFLC